MQAALSLSTLPQASFIQYKEQIFDALQMAASKPMDTWNVSGITLAAKYSPAEFFKEHSASSKTVSPELLGSLAAIAGSSSQNTVLILNTLVESPVSADSKRTILDQLTQGIHYSGSTAGAIGSIQKLEKSGDPAIISSLASLRKKLLLPASQEFLTYSREALKKVVDKSLPDSIRFKQMSLLALLPYKAKSEVLFQC
ncbi:MAG: hypothetical protein U5K54_13850 [Cytophagales bacterium]|nr:hypothetical protein [Cytophagales bacterium]